MLKTKTLIALGALTIGIMGASSAYADSVFNLSNVTLSTTMTGGTNAGTLTGSFTTNDSRSAITSYDITASASGAFSGFRYTPVNSTVTASTLPSQFFQLDSTANLFELRLYFTNGLSATGGTISSAFSYENEFLGGNRFLSGSVVAASSPTAAVPEPAAWGLMVIGLGAMGVSLRRRQKVTTRVAFA